MFNTAIFATAFRVFFLAAGLHAIYMITLWILKLRGFLNLNVGPDAFDWHTYEMVFGFCRVAIFGFLFTAGQHWSGKRLLSPRTMALLLTLWVLGRVAFFFNGHIAHIFYILDVFATLFALMKAWPLMQSQQKPNQRVIYLLILFLFTQMATVAQILNPDFPVPHRHAVHVGLLLIIGFIILIAGRTLPFFTSNAVPGSNPKTSPLIEKCVFDVTVITILAYAALPLHETLRYPVAGLLFITALAHAVRWFGWNPKASLKKPILAVLFSGYMWIFVGLAYLGFIVVTNEAFLPLKPSPAWHMLGIGAASVYIFGMMTRVALGHTGRPMQAPSVIAVSYLLLNVAMLLRVLFAAFNRLEDAYLYSAILWIMAFVFFTAVYAAKLWSPRIDGRPG